MFIRLIRELHLTGTYKLKKTDYQKDGYDLNKIQDPVFFMGPKDKFYQPFTRSLFHQIQSGSLVAKL